MGDGSLLAGAWLVKNSGKTRLTLSLLAGLLVLCVNASSAMAADIFAPPSEGCENLMAQSANLCVQGNRDTLGAYLQELVDADSSGQPSSGGGSPTLDEQRAQKTADNTPDPRALAYEEWARCKAAAPGKGPKGSAASSTNYDDACPLPPAPQRGNDQAQDPGRQPTTEDILYAAATVIHADGAGLYKRPLNVSYTNKYIPSIVAVTSPTQTHVINLLGHDITITLTATSYEWSWGDGTPNLVTTSTGSVWQEGMDLNTDPRLIRHYYTPPQGWRSMLDGPYPHEDREITLTTTWSGTATNPFTGETQTINGLVTTTETTGKFPLSHLVINNTDTWEEKQGH